MKRIQELPIQIETPDSTDVLAIDSTINDITQKITFEKLTESMRGNPIFDGVALEETDGRVVSHYGVATLVSGETTSYTVECAGFQLVPGALIYVDFSRVEDFQGVTQLTVNNTATTTVVFATTPQQQLVKGIYLFVYNGSAYGFVGTLDTNTTYDVMTGATSASAGQPGLVPSPSAGEENSILKGDGTWAPLSSMAGTLVAIEPGTATSAVDPIYNFESFDTELNPSASIDVDLMENSDTQSTILSKVSKMFKNIRYALTKTESKRDGISELIEDASTTDLDNYNYAGEYLAITSENIVNAPNPDINGHGFFLSVYQNGASCLQVLREYDASSTSTATQTVFIRQYNVMPPGGWTAWKNQSGQPDYSEVDRRIAAAKADFLDASYPIGSIYLSVRNVNPGTTFGGTWVAWGSGRVPVGVNASETEFQTVEKTGGSKTHTLTTAQLPAHAHGLNAHTHTIPALGGTATGGSHSHNESPKHIVSVSSTGGGYNAYTFNGTYSLHSTDSSGSLSMTVTTRASTTGGNSGNSANTGSGNAHNNLQPYITCYMWKRTA